MPLLVGRERFDGAARGQSGVRRANCLHVPCVDQLNFVPCAARIGESLQRLSGGKILGGNIVPGLWLRLRLHSVHVRLHYWRHHVRRCTRLRIRLGDVLCRCGRPDVVVTMVMVVMMVL